MQTITCKSLLSGKRRCRLFIEFIGVVFQDGTKVIVMRLELATSVATAGTFSFHSLLTIKHTIYDNAWEYCRTISELHKLPSPSP